MRYIVWGVFLYAASVGSASAATLYIDPPAANLFRGDAVTLSVRLDTDEAMEECVNAVDAVLTYTESITPVDISLGQSIMPIWVEQPVIDKEQRTITFAGGIPNGYCGRVEGDPRLTNTLLQIVVRAPGLQVGGGAASGVAEIAFAPETTVYLNDGLGTGVAPATLGATLTLADTIGSEIRDDWSTVVADDTLPPEEFTISLERGDGVSFGDEYYIVFNTTDKQTGISHYEVIEESTAEARLFSFGAATAPWVRARSPYTLNDQTLRSVIRVRAIDKAGNEYIATLQPDAALVRSPWRLEYLLVAVVVGVVAVAVGTFLMVRRQWRRRQSVVVGSESEDVTSNEQIVL